jgi:general secretion pathway protein J
LLPPADFSRCDAGFGLTEALVSLVLLGLLSVLLLEGGAGGQALWKSMISRAAVAEEIQVAQSILRERIIAAYPKTRLDASQPYPDFSGTTTRLTFVGPPNDASAPSALRRYTLAVDQSGALVLSSTSDLFGYGIEAEKAPVTTDVLLRGVGGIAISYLDAQGRWQPDWFKKPLPALVKVRVLFPAGDGRWWPTFLVRTAATIDTDCVNFNRSGHCGGRL